MKKILILCQHNTARSQMAEGYFRFFAGRSAEIYSGGIEPRAMHPMAYKIMDEDNIDIKQQAPILAKRLLKRKYDFLITLSDDIPASIIKKARARRHFHFPVDDPQYQQENKLENAYRETREQIKKFVLKFIGQELMETAEEEPIKDGQ